MTAHVRRRSPSAPTSSAGSASRRRATNRSPASRRCASAARPTCSPRCTTRSSCGRSSASRGPAGSRTSSSGRGSDVVISDAGVRGLVIQDRAEGSRVDGDRATSPTPALPMARAATETQKAGLTGLEFGLAIPGSVGGAVWANAGAHDSDVAGGHRVRARPRRGRHRGRSLPAADLALAYRDSRFKHARPGQPPRAHRRCDLRARARRPGDHQGSPRRDPTLAPGAPAPRAAVRRERVPQPGRATRPDG